MRPLRSILDVMVYRKAAIACATLVLLILGLAGCAGFKMFRLESRAPARPIVVDGKNDDWRGSLYFSVESQISLGFTNDAENLYICLSVTDPYKRNQIIMNGLVVWFDPKGGKAKSFGLKFPLGLQPGETPMRPEIPDMRDMPGGFPDEELSPEVSSESWTELEIINPKNQMPLKMKIEEAQGLEVKASAPAGMLIYELKIPLRKTPQTPWAVGAGAGQAVGLGFESLKSQTRGMSRGGYAGGGGGRTGMGGRPGMGGMGGRGGFGRGIEVPEDLKIWAIVKLLAPAGK